MTREQFTKFASQLFTSFPSLFEWLKEKSPDPHGTQQVWFKTLETISFTEAMSVLERWTTGALKAFSAFERDLVAVSIRAIVEKDRSRVDKRGVEEKQQAEDSHKYRKDYSPIAPILAEALKRKAELGEQSFRDYLLKEIPPTPAHSQPRFKCHLCLDAGKLLVWRNDIARAVEDQMMPLIEARGAYMVACACLKGEHYATENAYWSPMPRYSPDQFCRLKNGTIEEEQAQLEKWLKERDEAKKHAEFAAWVG